MDKKLRINQEVIKLERKKAILKRKLTKFTVISLTSSLLTSAGIVGCSKLLNHNDDDLGSNEVSVSDEYTIDTSTDDLSTLNVVLVNDGVSDEVINTANEELNDSGLDCEIRNIEEFYTVGTECFISLTSWEGDETKVIGNYYDSNNHADLLSLGMSVAFNSDIQKGVYEKNSAVPNLVPSNIETAVGDYIMPNVTLAVPVDGSLDTSKLTEGLARYNDSLKHVDIKSDKFLLRPNPLENNADYKRCLDLEVLHFNDLDGSYDVKADMVLKDPLLPKSFNRDISIDINKDNEVSITY